MKKIALVTGGTGDIGGAFTKSFLEAGYTVFLPVRDMEKAKRIFPDTAVYPHVCDLTSFENIRLYIVALRDRGIVFDAVVLAAGGRDKKRFWDSDFSGDTPQARQEHAIALMRENNVRTKETVVAALSAAYATDLSHTTLIVIGSHAAGFGPQHPFRHNEEGYVQAMMAVRELALTLRSRHVFKDVVLVEPGQVEGDFVREVFGDSSTVPVPKKELAKRVLRDAGLL